MLTKRQVAFVEALPHSKSVAEAARIAGYSEKRAKQAGRESLLSVTVQSMIVQARIELPNQGVTVDHLCKRIAEGLDAYETKFFAHKGQIRETVDFVDFGERLKYIRLACEILGILPGRVNADEEHDSNHSNLNLRDKTTVELLTEIEHQLTCRRKEKTEIPEGSSFQGNGKAAISTI